MTTITTRRPRTIYTNPSRAARPRPEGTGRELAWWWFMRISGVLLVFLALGHMFIMHVLVVLTGQEINFAFVQSRWGSPFWRIYDLLLLVLALVHGMRGARTIIGDYVANRTAKSFLFLMLVVIGGIWLAAGIAVIALFDPSVHDVAGPLR